MSRRMRHIGFSFVSVHFDSKCVLVAAACLIASWSASARAQDAIIRPHQLHQHISGFGALSVWTINMSGRSTDASVLATD